MISPALPPNEQKRMEALRKLNILDTSPEERFDRITRLAAQLFSCEFATVSLIDSTRQWFKSKVNLDVDETSRDIAFCAHAILETDALIVQDTHKDKRFSSNPLVVEDPYIRFYAGIKLMVDGQAVGTICVFDTTPRTFSAQQLTSLKDLGSLVELELERTDLSVMSQELDTKHQELVESQKLLRVRSAILEKVVNTEPLSFVLDDIVAAVEKEYKNQLCSILLLDGTQLRLGAAPSLPGFYNDLIDGVEIGLGQGACGTAAFLNERVITDDLTTHSYWASWRYAAKQANLGACWSQPICGADGKVLGTFAIYHKEAGVPSDEDITRIEYFAHVASIAIERERADEIIWRQANYDSLTGLANRHLMEDNLSHALSSADRLSTKVAVMFLDLDHFKDINDTMGHGVGDELLVQCARRIERCVRQNDNVARLGGDEFVIIINNLHDVKNVERVTHDLLSSLSKPLTIENEVIHTSASIGITLYPDDAQDVSSLLKNADQAMFRVKASGRNSYEFYTESMREAAVKRLGLLNDLRYATQNDEFFIEYQPIVALDSGDIHKGEALIRWNHPKRGLIRPDDFIPLAEESGLIIEISNWVFSQVCDDINRWREAYCKDLQLSINTSASHYFSSEPNIMEWMTALLKTNTPSSALLIEITESLLMDADEKVSQKLFQFRQAGVSIALDDFGTGFSSISYLKKFPTDYIKIDRSFVNSMTEVSNDKILCEAIIVMAKKLGIQVVAEGIETSEQLNILKNMGCEYGQGYYFSKPVSKSQFESILMKQSEEKKS